MQYNLSLVIQWIDNATQALKQVEWNIKGFAQRNQAMLKKVAVASWVALAWLSVAIRNTTQAYMAQERAETRLAQISRQVIGATDEQIQWFIRLAWELQKVWVVWDEVIIAWQSQIASFTKNHEVVSLLTKDLADLSVATYWVNVSQEQAIQSANIMWKALQWQLWALTRAWVLVSDEYAEAFKQANTEHERAIILSQIIQDNYWWLNEAMRDTAEWWLQALNNSFSDMRESIGQSLVPLIQAFAKTMIPIIDNAKKRIDENQKLTITIIGVTTALLWTVTAVSTFLLIKWPLIAWIGAIKWALIWLKVVLWLLSWKVLAVWAVVWWLAVLVVKNMDKIKQAVSDVKWWFQLQRNADTFLWKTIRVVENKIKPIVDLFRRLQRTASQVFNYVGRWLWFISWPWMEATPFNAPWVANISRALIEQASNAHFGSSSLINMPDLWDIAWLPTWWWGWWWGWWWKTVLEQNFDDIKRSAEQAFQTVNSLIDTQGGNVLQLWEEYKRLKWQIEDIDKSIQEIFWKWQRDIANRYLQIQEELWNTRKSITKALEQGNKEELENLKIKKQQLEAELELAWANSTIDDIERARYERNRSETQRILDDVQQQIREKEEEKQQVIELAELKREQIKTEYQEYRQLIDQKMMLDKEYFAFFNEKLEEQRTWLQQVNDARVQLRWWSTGSVNINVWNVEINNWQDEVRFKNMLEDVIIKAQRWQALWFM